MKKVFILLLSGNLLLNYCYSQNIRLPAFNGRFYSNDSSVMVKEIENEYNNTKCPKIYGKIRVIIIPHFLPHTLRMNVEAIRALENKKVENIVIVSNTHDKTKFPYIAIDNSDYWQTRLGNVEVNKHISDKIIELCPETKYVPEAFIKDHTIELILPVFQFILKNNFKITPILFGNSFYLNEDIDDKYKKLALTLSSILGKNDILVVSNDMVHWPENYELGKVTDQRTIEIIMEKNINKLELFEKELFDKKYPDIRILSCGRDGIKTAMEYFNLIGSGDIMLINYDLKKFKANNYVGCSSLFFAITQVKAH